MEYDIKFVIDGEVKDLKSKIRSTGADVGGMQKALADFTKAINKSAEKYPEHFKGAAKYAKDLNAYLDKISKQKTPYSLSQQKNIAAGFNQLTDMTTKAGRAASAQPEIDRKAAIKAARDEERAVSRLAKAQEVAASKHLSNLIRTRYALYDVANESRRVGLVTVGVGLAAVKLGADFEAAFADVKRTTGATGTELENLRTSLVEISQTTPVSFKDITAIATLGAQMGIGAGSIDEFSSTVSQFATVTSVSADTAATSFGRIGELLNVSASGYERLASSVLYAGRNSLATEEQILTLTTQIAASSQQAGFAADEVIGLATALASLGIAPEQARGVILRLFSDFDKVISENGQQLKDYAALMGMTSEAVANMWKTDAPAFFVQFTKALGSTASSAEDMNGILSALGIVETREVNVLQRLAGNHDLLVKSMEDAGMAYSENTDLSDQSAQKMETLSAKIQKLINNITAFGAAIGENLGTFLKPLVDLMSMLTKMLTSSPIARVLTTIGIVLSVGTGIFLLYKAAIAQSIASLFAFKTTMQGLAADFNITAINLRTLRAAMLEVGVSAGVMSTGFAKAKIGMAGMVANTRAMASSLMIAVPQMVAISAAMGIAAIASKSFHDQNAATTKSINELSDAGKELSKIDFFKERTGADRKLGLNNFTGELTDFQVALKDTKAISNEVAHGLMTVFGQGDFSNISVAKGHFEEMDNALTEMASNGQMELAAQRYHEIAVEAGKVGFTSAEVAKIMPNFYAAITSGTNSLIGLSDAQVAAADSGTDLSSVIKDRLIESMIGGATQQASFANAIEEFSTSLVESKGNISAWSVSSRKALSSFTSLINEIAAMSGNDMSKAIMMTAAAISQIESAGGNASAQVQGLVVRLNSMYGLNLNGATITSIAQLQALIASTGGVAAATRAEIQLLLSGGGYADIMKKAFEQAKKSITSSGAAAKKVVRTINDYASDLKSLFSDIFDRAFSLTDATDGLESGWIGVKSRVEDAKQSVIDLKQELEDMSAEKGILQYQLGVADKYGDTLRAAKIRAQILKLDKQMISKEEEKAKAQEASTLTLTGSTEAAIENKKAIREQVQAAGELIAAYAATVQANGKLPTKSDIANFTADVVKKFTDQATAIGFSADELKTYTTIISGFGRAAASVEKPNVEVTLNPVTTAIKAYLAEKKESSVSLKPTYDTSAFDAMMAALQAQAKRNPITLDFQAGTLPGTLAGNAPNSIGPTLGNYSFTPTATATIRATLASYEKALAAAKVSKTNATRAGNAGGVIIAQKTIDSMTKKIAALKSQYQFASGGYVSGPGSSTSDSIAASLSNGEFVMNAEATKFFGVDFMNSLNNMRPTTAVARSTRGSTNGTGSGVVSLSPEDRALLRAAVDRPISLYTENQKIASSANAGNVLLAQRGMN